MKKLVLILSLIVFKTYGQELYVFSEPASNMPARSFSIKQSGKFLRNLTTNNAESRLTTELMFGASKNLMLHVAGTFSNMYSSAYRIESARFYGKYRFLSTDNLYRHFRMAVFAEGSLSQNPGIYDELSLEGDQSGIQAGIIATQLLHKLAISSTISWTERIQDDKILPQQYPYRAVNYSLSAGYLLLPKSYTDYDQTNLNLYIELLGQQTVDLKHYYVDLAPAAQLIFNSQAKLNLGYRFQLGGDMKRMAEKSWLLSFEWLFLDVWKKR